MGPRKRGITQGSCRGRNFSVWEWNRKWALLHCVGFEFRVLHGRDSGEPDGKEHGT